MIFWNDQYDWFEFSFAVGPSAFRTDHDDAQESKQQLLNETIMKLVFDEEETRTKELLTAVVHSDAWYVNYVGGASSEAISVSEVPAKKYRLSIDEEDGRNAKQKKKSGKGGNLVFLYDAQAIDKLGARKQSLRKIDGRELVRSIPKSANGLLLHLGDAPPSELSSEYFSDLQSIADACDLEDCLVLPAPGQTEKILKATWFVRVKKDNAPYHLYIDRTTSEGWVAEVYTHKYHVSSFHAHEVVEMSGEQLFRLVCQNAEVDGMMINGVSKTGRGDAKMHRMILSVGEAAGILEGNDVRPGVFPLPARSMEEVEFWLDSRKFPKTGRQYVSATRDGVEYTVAVVEADSNWRTQESYSEQFKYKGPTISPVFSVSNEAPSERPSAINCPGLIAYALNCGAWQAKDATRYWNRGTNLLVARFVPADEREESRKRTLLAKELAKFLPEGANEIPRTAFRTVKGAALIRQHSYGATREWIEATIKKAESCTKAWSFGFGV